MAKTKEQIAKDIAFMLRACIHGTELVVKDIPTLRQPKRNGFKPYCLRYDNLSGKALVYPWSGAVEGWEIPVNKVDKDTLNFIFESAKLCAQIDNIL